MLNGFSQRRARGTLMPVYYYLGFQRAPPSAACPGAKCQVAPTICNDLRDDIYEPRLDRGNATGNVQIDLIWLASRESAGHASVIGNVATLQWTGPSSAYRPVDVTIPSAKQLAGISSLQLALVVNEQGKLLDHCVQPGSYDLQSASYSTDTKKVQTLFVPCLSEPITLLSRSDSSNQPRRSSILRRFQLPSDTAESTDITIREEAGYALDKHLWDASLHFSRWLLSKDGQCKLCLDGSVQADTSTPLRIVELGAGTGFLSVLMGVLCRRRCHITATDLTDAIPLLSGNIASNRGVFTSEASVEASVLDWQQPIPSDIARRGCDIVLVADCTYNPSYFDALSTTIAALLGSDAANVDSKNRQAPFCLLAKKHRHVDEEQLWPALAAAGLHCQRVHGNDPEAPPSYDDSLADSHARRGWAIYQITVV